MKPSWGVWITGLPASGKSTIAKALATRLESMGVLVQVLESDVLRRVLTPRPSYTDEERETFYKSMVYIGSLLASNGVNVVFDATANRRRWRDEARRAIPRFMEVYVDTPLEVCMKRDPKGIYRKAGRGRAQTVPGAQQTYEPPTRPELRIEGTLPADRSAGALVEAMRSHGFDLQPVD